MKPPSSAGLKLWLPRTGRIANRGLGGAVSWVLAVWVSLLVAWVGTAGAESLGPSSRRTGLVISEIMYHPTNRVDGRNLEFIEIFNSQPIAENLSGYRLNGDVDFTFPPHTLLESDGFLVVAPHPADVQSVYGLTEVLGGFTNRLSDSAGTIRLRNRVGAVLLEASYGDAPPWPAAADGAGHSLVLARPSRGERDPAAWAGSSLRGGSPGGHEPTSLEPLRSVVINELLAHTDDPELEFIELYNRSVQTVNLSGAVLTDDPTTHRFIIPGGTTLAPNRCLAFTQGQLGFALNAAGGTIYLVNPEATRVVDAVRFSAQAKGIALGRQPDGTPDFSPLRVPTPGTNNSAVRLADIVISEIMYHPLSGNDEEQYVELFNAGINPVDLGGWQFVDGIRYTFPAGWQLWPGNFVVVAKNRARLQTNYVQLNATNCVGNFNGNLANGGERLALAQPEAILTTNGNTLLTNVHQVVVDEVTYRHGGRWGRWSDGGGSSLELRDPWSDHRRADNWGDSDESAKSEWTTVEFTGQLIEGDGGESSRLEVIATAASECLLDDVEVVYQGANRIASPEAHLNSGQGSWVAEGNHEMMSWQPTGGTTSSGCLHLRASGRGDYMANRIMVGLNTAIPANATATLRARARWQRGEPEVVLRLTGNFLEAVGRLPAPTNLGTPGAANTQATSNTGPAIFDVTHWPALPAANQTVVITARVSDPQGITNVALQYRADPATALATTSLVDDGTRGDAAAGDGVFSVALPGQAAGQLIAFRIAAWDARGASNRFPNLGSLYPTDALRPECLVRFGEPQPTAGSRRFGNYHIWVTEATYNQWVTRGNAHNGTLDCTVVYEDQRVVYNVGALYSGSFNTMRATSSPLDPLTQSPISGYNLVFAADDLLLGTEDFALDPNARPYFAQHEQIPYWLARELDLPYCHRRYANVFFNGTLRTVFEDTQQPARDLVEEFYPDDPDGDLYKVEVWWGTTDFAGGGGGYHAEPPLEQYRRGTEKNLARYRWTLQKRGALGSPSDYTTVFQLVDAMTAAPASYTAAVESVMDVEQCMRILAVERLVGNHDSWGRHAPHNLYAYKPTRSGWQLLMYDMDYSFYGGENPTDDLVNGAFNGDAQLNTLVTHPPFLRAYLRALQDATNGPLARDALTGRLPRVDALLDANYTTISAVNGLGAAELSPDYLGAGWGYSLRGWFTHRHAAIESTLARYGNPAFTVNAASASATNWLTLTGTAPVEIKTLTVNGAVYPATWTTVTGWQLTVALTNGNNALLIQGLDRLGRPLSHADATHTVACTGGGEPPEDNLVINEIMYHPRVPNAGFIEILNRATNTAFHLAGWRLRGADFTFPPGTLVRPGQFLVVAKDRAVFGQTYGWHIRVAGEYAGTLDNGGETLSLILPGAIAAQDRVVDHVTYDDDPPWPPEADGAGPSLQLMDAAQDNARVANWAVAGTNVPPPPAPEWRYVTANGHASSSTLYLYLQSAGDVYVDDLKLVAGSVPEAGPNLLRNGDFESPWPGPWSVAFNHMASSSSAAIRHAGSASLHLVASDGGSTWDSAVAQDIAPGLAQGEPYTLSYWYLPSTNGSGLTLRLSGSGILSSHSIAPDEASFRSDAATPGATNSVRAILPSFRPIWLNELMPDNVGGLRDGQGQPEPWVELFNTGDQPVSLGGCVLADNFTNSAPWAFPANTVIGPRGFLLVWLDGEPTESAADELHTSFRAAPFNGVLVLSMATPEGPVVLDYIRYGEIGADSSLGFHPDGDAQPRMRFYHPTPGTANDNTPAPTPLFINEWMADNVRAVADPADGDFEDWFELYNPNGVAVDLTGYRLTDDPSGTDRWTIPSGAVIQPYSFLLVWADGEPGQGSPTREDLHASFKLERNGEAIGLVAPNGQLVDAVYFEAQTQDVSQGRWPNGTPEPFYAMTAPTPRAANRIPAENLPGLRIESASVDSGGLMTLSWTAQPGRVYRLQQGSELVDPTWQDLPGDVIALQDAASKSFLLPPENPCQFYRVRLLSDPGDFAPAGLPPPRPTGVQAVAGNARVVVSWFGAFGATGFQVKRGTSPGVHPTVFSATVSPFVDTSAQNGATYYYVVSALKGTLESPNSHEVSGTPLAPPAGVSATASTGQVTLTWQPAAGATGYRVTRGLAPGVYSTSVLVAAPPYADRTVLDGTTYYYVVTTIHGANESENSSEASAATPLLPPTDVTATAGPGRVTLCWTASSGATAYVVRRGIVSGVYVTDVTAAGSPFLDSAVVNDTTYYYAVRAANAQDSSALSAEVSATPFAPTNAVEFLGRDLTTRGNWMGQYGADGYNVLGDAALDPAYATVSAMGQELYVWSYNAPEWPGALQKPHAPAERISACWHSPDFVDEGYFTLDIAFTDGQPHELALYFQEHDFLARTQAVRLLDAETQAVLDTRVLSGFENGVYLVWNLRGHVHIRIINTEGINSVLSGIFFGPAAAPLSLLK